MIICDKRSINETKIRTFGKKGTKTTLLKAATGPNSARTISITSFANCSSGIVQPEGIFEVYFENIIPLL